MHGGTLLNDQVQALIDGLVESGKEVGVQVAAYLDGALVVDAWAGHANPVVGLPVTGETLFTSWSTTKGFVATCLHILAERGLLGYDDPIAAHWPEFGRRGKEAITIRHALTHTAGIPQMPAAVTPELISDWEALCRAIEALEPLWAPGTMVGYHVYTFGWIIGELIRRVDGRPLAQFAREELCQPLGIRDFYLGIPDAAADRVAPLIAEPARPGGAEGLSAQVSPPQINDPMIFNRPDVRRASIPAAGGIMSARAIARHYAMLAGHGSVDATRILSAERVEIIRALQTDAMDVVLGHRNRKGLGYMLGGAADRGGERFMGPSGGEFGHAGRGGSLGFADPARGLAFGLTKNRMVDGPDQRTTTSYIVAETIRKHLDGEV